jgi:hypothetical protein
MDTDETVDRAAWRGPLTPTVQQAWRLQGITAQGTAETVEFSTEAAKIMDPAAPHFADEMRGYASLVRRQQSETAVAYVCRVWRWTADRWAEVLPFSVPKRAPWITAPPLPEWASEPPSGERDGDAAGGARDAAG